MQAVLADPATAPIPEPLRATLAFLRKVTRQPDAVTADDVRALLALGVTRAQVEDALEVGFAFNVITRLADLRIQVGRARRSRLERPAQSRLQVILITPARTERGRGPGSRAAGGPFAVKERP